ncbi:MAG: hypothetical protein HOP12_15730 [Candidatus Eisenbacteria bacterium]|uniref:Uncharacterized protein n=1 Tax=Eiseniibacteriota bacterium TaxID=2212470 RepID=A0A849SU01_UNCEI|nr:hypothetical protein [Candidatus Eisenbacteria bacterium]
MAVETPQFAATSPPPVTDAEALRPADPLHVARAIERLRDASGIASRVVLPFDDGAGIEGKVLLVQRGQELTATVIASNPETAQQFVRQVDELRQALVDRGFNDPRVGVMAAATVSDGREAGSRGSDAGTGRNDFGRSPRSRDEQSTSQRQDPNARRRETRHGRREE